MSRRNKILVPEARTQLDQMKAKLADTANPDHAKFEVARELGIPLKKGKNGQLTSEQAGKVGGRLGGQMVKELTKIAMENLHRK